MENQRERILIADDEKEIRDILRLLLTQEGYQVAEAENGKEALDKADEGIQLYILDVNMPVMSGFAAAMEIRKHSDAPVMFLTAYSGEADMTIGFSSGADDYLVKPFSKVNELPEVVIPKGYRLDEMLDFEGDLWDEKPEFQEEVRIHFE